MLWDTLNGVFLGAVSLCPLSVTPIWAAPTSRTCATRAERRRKRPRKRRRAGLTTAPSFRYMVSSLRGRFGFAKIAPGRCLARWITPLAVSSAMMRPMLKVTLFFWLKTRSPPHRRAASHVVYELRPAWKQDEAHTVGRLAKLHSVKASDFCLIG